MEKILFISDAVSMSRECLNFSCYLGNLTHSKVTGVFLENLDSELRSSEDLAEIAVCAPTPGASPDEQKRKYREENISLFRNICESNGVNCEIHKNKGIPANEVIKESKYADLLVIDSTTSFSWKSESNPTSFVKEILERAECPVVIAPTTFQGIDEIVFTYNGSMSSMFAIKQFTYLLPAFNENKVTVLSVVKPGERLKGDEQMLQEWLNIHYESADLLIIEDTNIRTGLLGELLTRENAFVVMGAYGRSLLSNRVIPNPAEPVIKLISQPIFISHY
ncbi:hypothetical protein SAMN05660909_05512 [Chitinophaga terrae (ex Kim and Jung 2007)]|uniref:Universal stress protein n=1 Tax=Chitinophaga terrae (ex Kim and Jung 2007) TaxID=408074 RepID=A0A1H4GM51_9BACT|nr:universal stress protein [Chitinophaga terrae (ex Kim and Jung 2007)]MDQ0110216.1 nucleotide-binding universal stress UspA family protein [Chitinophaga terrae (ex Kim and Jung 2007)]GEP93601.1 hypothetical protein CTE07_52460 [Chitinophaga terrae (ex Kim and Jung 2007)]SEB10685.1 hypothetical protein SAMN05660909_05512 [Chitinophaga terrae (ex Kim and Jung 2007)]